MIALKGLLVLIGAMVVTAPVVFGLRMLEEAVGGNVAVAMAGLLAFGLCCIWVKLGDEN